MPNNESTTTPSVLSRRHLLGAAGAVGTAVATIGVVGVASAAPDSGAAEDAVADAVDGPIVVHVRDLSSGTLDVFTGTGSRQVRDLDLAARLAHAASSSTIQV
jgi:nitrous oxide reductase